MSSYLHTLAPDGPQHFLPIEQSEMCFYVILVVAILSVDVAVVN